ncbi:MAG TPA: hypothetical protein VL125_02625, partial [Pelobium sp.]|nr:hypothetical protein [Pelobium sp.]
MAKFYLPKNHLKVAFAVILNFIMVLLFSSPSYSQSVAGTLDFDAADGTVVTKDGDGGSTDIPNIEYQIFSTDINLIPNGTAWTYYGDIGLGIGGIVGDLTDGDPIIVIKSANGAEFSFNGILTGNRDGIMQKIIIEGFRNGTSTGSVTLDLDYMVTGVNTFTSTELTPAIFQNVDEVRLTNPDIPLGASSEVVTIGIDQLVFGDPVTASANTTPTATNLTQSKSATEGGSAVALTDIVVTDADAGETITATLSLSNVAAGTLSTGTYGAATSTYNAGTGVWTVNGSVADVNAALAAVAFTPSANHDQNFTITTSIGDAANAGPADGTISFTVTAVNDDPTVSGLPASLTFTEDATTSELDLTGIAIADVDAGTASITVVLKASAGTFSLAAGTGMTLSGNATSEISLSGKLGDVNTYLNTPSNIWYLPASNASGANAASITLTANDNGNTGTGGGTAVSLGAIDIDITAVNDAPIITTTGGTTAFYGTSITIDNSLTISDVDNINLATATVSISGGFQDGEDELAFTNNGSNMGNITGSYNALTGVLSLTSAGATATLAQWQVALRAITYHNTSATPNTANRTVSFMATDGTDASSAVTKTVSVAGIAVITSATYDADAGVLAVTGTNMTAGDTIDPSKLTLTGEGGSTYTLTTANVTASSATAFSITLNATDKAALNQILNKNGTVSTGTTTYNLAAATNWDNTASAAADLTGNGITVSNVAVPTITSATYDASTGALVVTGTGLLKLSGATNDIVANKFTFTGEGGATYTFTDTSNGEITSGTSFTLTLSATDRAGVNLMMNKNGTSSTGGTTYNLAAAEDWAAGTNVAVTVADVTGNGITASNVAVPTITSATYDASTGALVVTGTGLLKLSGATNDIVANKFTFTGEGGSAYTFTDTSNGEITSGTSFTLTLSATDKAGVNLIINKNGTSSTGATTY